MRIAFVADSFLHDPTTGVNGTQVQMFNLASAFARRGHEVHYIAATRDRSRASEPPDGVTFHWIEQKTTVFSWCRDLGKYRRILDEIAPDVVYQRGRSHLTWVAARWAQDRGRGFFWGSNGEDSCTFWKATKRVRSSTRPLWKKTLLYPVTAVKDHLIHEGIRGATGVINQTRQQAESLEANYRKAGRVLPSTFLPPDDAAPPKERIVLWMANLGHAKQPELFCRLAEHCADLGGWRFLLGGGTDVDDYRRDLEAQAGENVELLGPVPFERTADLYARASLFVNTSRPEGDGLPNAFIQAWLHKTPILSLHHDPNGWIGEHGLGFCAHGDWQRFLDAGRELLERGADGEACGRFARETFASEKTIDVYLEMFARN